MNKIMSKQMDFVTNMVCEITHLSRAELHSRNRDRHLVDARRLAYALIRELFGTPYLIMGKYFGKNHASVIHALKTHKNLLDYDDIYRGRYVRTFRLMYEKYNEEVIDFLKDKLNDEKNSDLVRTIREDSKIA